MAEKKTSKKKATKKKAVAKKEVKVKEPVKVKKSEMVTLFEEMVDKVYAGDVKLAEKVVIDFIKKKLNSVK